LWEAVKVREKKFGENWQVFITTDHGRGEPLGKDHGGQSDAERSTWIVTNAKGLNTYFGKSGDNNPVPGIVDIMPTIGRHLAVPFPKEQAFELDGVALTGKISVSNPNAKREGDKITLTWKSSEEDGEVKIWLAVTNHFEEGGSDQYMLMKQLPVTDEKVILDVSKLPKGFYKMVIEGKYNAVNRWIVEK
jgi:hypothetical protein